MELEQEGFQGYRGKIVIAMPLEILLKQRKHTPRGDDEEDHVVDFDRD